jgi:hypothetical protein
LSSAHSSRSTAGIESRRERRGYLNKKIFQGKPSGISQTFPRVPLGKQAEVVPGSIPFPAK